MISNYDKTLRSDCLYLALHLCKCQWHLWLNNRLEMCIWVLGMFFELRVLVICAKFLSTDNPGKLSKSAHHKSVNFVCRDAPIPHLRS